ncbi:hypothetical protein ACP6JC_004238 [Aspergillus fumigatus]
MVLSPRFHLFEIGDQPWCPDWVIAYIQSYLTSVWNLHIPPLSRTSPAGIAAELVTENLPDASSYTFVDCCAGAGGPTSTMERVLNLQLQEQGKRPARFVLTDLHPRIDAWSAIAKKQEHVTFIPDSRDATSCGRVAAEGKECRVEECGGVGGFVYVGFSFPSFEEELVVTLTAQYFRVRAAQLLLAAEYPGYGAVSVLSYAAAVLAFALASVLHICGAAVLGGLFVRWVGVDVAV